MVHNSSGLLLVNIILHILLVLMLRLHRIAVVFAIEVLIMLLLMVRLVLSVMVAVLFLNLLPKLLLDIPLVIRFWLPVSSPVLISSVHNVENLSHTFRTRF